jgi:hypothetical protein
MSPKSDELRAQARAAETSASAATHPGVKRQFLSIARSWHALADMVERGDVIDVPIAIVKPGEGGT